VIAFGGLPGNESAPFWIDSIAQYPGPASSQRLDFKARGFDPRAEIDCVGPRIRRDQLEKQALRAVQRFG
jgi:hypothetical protein